MYIDRTYQVQYLQTIKPTILLIIFTIILFFRIHYTLNSRCKIESALGFGQYRDIVG